MRKRSHHLFTFVIVLVLCVVAGILWVVVHRADTSMPFATTNGPLGSNPTVIFNEPDQSFSFSMPADMHFSTSNAKDDNGNAAEIDTFKGGTTERNFVIRIVPWNSYDEITPALIEQNISGGEVSDVRTISVDGSKGVSFVSADNNFGIHPREIWFSRSNKLYQITTYPSFGDELINILATWQWSNS